MVEPQPIDPTRDTKGRFGPGNRFGKGGPRRRAFELRRAVEDAVSAEHLSALARKAVRMALEGNVMAMRLVFERTCGKTPEVPLEGEPLPVQLPRLETAADCSRALDMLIECLCKGEGDRETTRMLIEAIQVRLKAIEATELEVRLAQLEADAKHTLERRR